MTEDANTQLLVSLGKLEQQNEHQSQHLDRIEKKLDGKANQHEVDRRFGEVDDKFKEQKKFNWYIAGTAIAAFLGLIATLGKAILGI